MKTRHAYTLLLSLSVGASVAVAQERVIPTDPGAQSGNTGAAGAHAEPINPNAPRLGDRIPADRGTSVGETEASEPVVGVVPSHDAAKTVQKLSRLNQREVSFSRLASDRAQSPEVREFATEMVRVHDNTAQELATLAARRGATQGPRELDESRDDREALARKSGREFDRAYVEAMVEAHEKSITTLESAAGADDTEVAAFATRTLPQMRAHLQRAETLKRDLR
jgi:putative membrane protein